MDIYFLILLTNIDGGATLRLVGRAHPPHMDAMIKPSSASKTNCSSSSNDPKKALLVDLAGVIDKFNALLTWLQPTAAMSVGTLANNLVQLNSSGKIPSQTLPVATTHEAIAGTMSNKIMTPLTTQKAIQNITNGRLPIRKIVTQTSTVSLNGNPRTVYYKIYGASGNSATTTSVDSIASALGGTLSSPGRAFGGDAVTGGAPGGGGLACGTINTTNKSSIRVTIGSGVINGHVEFEWYANA